MPTNLSLLDRIAQLYERALDWQRFYNRPGAASSDEMSHMGEVLLLTSDRHFISQESVGRLLELQQDARSGSPVDSLLRDFFVGNKEIAAFSQSPADGRPLQITPAAVLAAGPASFIERAGGSLVATVPDVLEKIARLGLPMAPALPEALPADTVVESEGGPTVAVSVVDEVVDGTSQGTPEDDPGSSTEAILNQGLVTYAGVMPGLALPALGPMVFV